MPVSRTKTEVEVTDDDYNNVATVDVYLDPVDDTPYGIKLYGRDTFEFLTESKMKSLIKGLQLALKTRAAS